VPIEIHRAQLNDEITVKHPTLGTEWRLDPFSEPTAYGLVLGFKLKRLVPGEFLFMLAKDYTVPPENVVTAKELVSEVYPQSYAKQFSDVAIDSIRDLGDGWWVADYRFTHVKMGAIVKRERVKTVRRHVLLTSAEGWPEAMEAHADAVAAWMTSTFAPLDR
jgi:hypothetical protein